jgi:hypothetical protein
VRMTINLGFDYVAGSIRVRVGDAEMSVEELDQASGTFRIEMPGDADDLVSIDYQRTIYGGGAPRATVELGTADACIYCGSRSDLRDEHVIPYGLEGEFVLRKASCKACADKTSRIELEVLRGSLLPARTALRMRTRRKSSRPATLSVIEVDTEGHRTSRQVAVAEHPTVIALPIFDAPALLRGAEIPNLVIKDVWKRFVGLATLPASSSQLDGGQVGVQVPMDVYAFARMLAKIAHGFVAGAGIDGDIETELPSAMFADGELLGWWVGGAPDVTLLDPGLHLVRVSVVDGDVQVRIRLFAQFGGPEYLVIAGRRVNPTPQVEPSFTVKSAAVPTLADSSWSCRTRRLSHGCVTVAWIEPRQRPVWGCR